jgi:hypothetical protein
MNAGTSIRGLALETLLYALSLSRSLMLNSAGRRYRGGSRNDQGLVMTTFLLVIS